MTIEDSKRFGSVSEETITAFEREKNIVIPQQYRTFLLMHNGGYPSPATIELPKLDNITDVRQLYGLHDGEYWASLRWAFDNFQDRIPSEFLPIGDDPMGNAFIIGLTGTRAGKIYFWDHELEIDKFPNYDNITDVAATFEQFLAQCFEWIDPDETIQDKIVRTNDVSKLSELIRSGFDVNSKNEFDRTMIESAAIKGSTEIVALLLAHGATPNQALEYAIKNHEEFPKEAYEQIIAILENHT